MTCDKANEPVAGMLQYCLFRVQQRDIHMEVFCNNQKQSTRGVGIRVRPKIKGKFYYLVPRLIKLGRYFKYREV